MADDTLGLGRSSATAIDRPPSYDDLVGDAKKVSPIWGQWFSTLADTLIGYLSEYGLFIPKLTTAQRDDIQDPQDGQFIYNTTTNTLQVYLGGATNAWENVTTAP